MWIVIGDSIGHNGGYRPDARAHLMGFLPPRSILAAAKEPQECRLLRTFERQLELAPFPTLSPEFEL